MATIAENIQTLRSIKSDLKNAITNKGGSVGNDFKTYAQAITNLPSGGGGGTENEDGLVTRRLSVYSNDRVIMVGTYAFANCTSLISITLPLCEYIGSNAFYRCTKLASIDLPNCLLINSYGFENCSSLMSLNLPLCTSIMTSAFAFGQRLQSISLPNCSYVGDGAFGWCSALPSVNLPLCTSFGKDFLDNCSTFMYCSALSIVKIPLCSDIGKHAFLDCINLKEVYLNSVSSVTTISSNTFSNCSNLTSVYVPASLVDAFKVAKYWSSISDKIVAYREPTDPSEPIQYPPLIYSAKSAGSTITVNGETITLKQGENITLDYPNEITSVKATNNTALTYIQIPNTVTSIEDNAFTGCAALTNFNFNGTMEQWGAITLGTDWNKDAGFTVVHCTDGDVTLEEPIQPTPLIYSTNAAGSTIRVNGEAVTLELGENIVLDYPNDITSLKARDNTALTYIQIPNTVTSLDRQVFWRCTSLVSISIPDGVTKIGDGAFYNCSKLTDFNFNGTKAQWVSITKGNDWNTDAAFTVVHCTDGDIILRKNN